MPLLEDILKFIQMGTYLGLLLFMPIALLWILAILYILKGPDE